MNAAVIKAAPLFERELRAVVAEARINAETLRAGAEAALRRGRSHLYCTLTEAANEQARIGLQYLRLADRWRAIAEGQQ